ncbi:TIGR02587 family membrane protein [Azospirillum sp. RWY-5-1]|uniref:TIGR02587 family membrane protein n=1 Tax=Azospirillum oleiclasticum TaxID=2735135 RepID=A0ABX2T6M2_9PROT|nr:TIGR02587 family membrane protein [Azospirillum oleiclasticum]NYZ18921.1 TIGR02587 family membrane protein [Azospirillum oleiclasticum]
MTSVTAAKDRRSAAAESERLFRIGLARAFGGAIIFSLPIFMTMEMWYLGFYMDRLRLALMLAAGVPLLVGLSHYVGFEDTFNWREDLIDAFVAYAVGFAAAGTVLLCFGVIGPDMTADEIVGKVSLQALAGAIGALLAQNQFGQSVNDAEPPGQRVKGYFAELFIMAVGATFLAFNVAPTEEMIVISFQMTVWHTLALVLLSLLMMHGFVYALRFQGQEEHRPEDAPGWSLFLRYTVAGYAVCLVMSLYVLWSFGRLDGMGVRSAVMAAMVLCFPASVGAAAARLIL